MVFHKAVRIGDLSHAGERRRRGRRPPLAGARLPGGLRDGPAGHAAAAGRVMAGPAQLPARARLFRGRVHHGPAQAQGGISQESKSEGATFFNPSL